MYYFAEIFSIIQGIYVTFRKQIVIVLSAAHDTVEIYFISKK